VKRTEGCTKEQHCRRGNNGELNCALLQELPCEAQVPRTRFGNASAPQLAPRCMQWARGSPRGMLGWGRESNLAKVNRQAP